MRIAIVAVVAVALGACVQHQAAQEPDIHDIERECHVGGRAFVETWTCYRVGLTSMSAGTSSDIRDVYVATGDYLATQVNKGWMTDAEAKLAMAEAKKKAFDDTWARMQARSVTTRAPVPAYSPAIIPPAPMPTYNTPTEGWGSQPQMIYTPKGGVMCQRIGLNSVMCN